MLLRTLHVLLLDEAVLLPNRLKQQPEVVAVGDADFAPAFLLREVEGVAFGEGSTFFAVDGLGTAFSSGTRSAPAISGACADGCAAGVTTPACRGPGGAPTSSTR